MKTIEIIEGKLVQDRITKKVYVILNQSNTGSSAYGIMVAVSGADGIRQIPKVQLEDYVEESFVH
jgi:hypothetical protein